MATARRLAGSPINLCSSLGTYYLPFSSSRASYLLSQGRKAMTLRWIKIEGIFVEETLKPGKSKAICQLPRWGNETGGRRGEGESRGNRDGLWQKWPPSEGQTPRKEGVWNSGTHSAPSFIQQSFPRACWHESTRAKSQRRVRPPLPPPGLPGAPTTTAMDPALFLLLSTLIYTTQAWALCA